MKLQRYYVSVNPSWCFESGYTGLVCMAEDVALLEAAHAELLAAAKGLLGLAERHGWLHVAVDTARAAIAKAEGEAA